MFNQKEYDERNKEKIKQRKKKYYIKNREYILHKSKQYNMEHREQTIQRIKQWQKENYQKIVEYIRGYQKTKKYLEYQRQYRENNREKILEWQRMWRTNNPKKAKMIAIKHYNKRERDFGFIPLNEPFENSVAHHINKDDVVYIPEKIHRNIRHCLESGKNMDKINEIAMSYI